MRTNIREFLDKLLDEENWDIVELENSRGEVMYFDQICVLPESDSTYYAILQPVAPNGDEIDDPMVFVFKNADSDDISIDLVTDQYVIHDVFAEYKRLRSSNGDDDFDGEEMEYSDEDLDELEMLDELEEPDEIEEV